jgi:hypothetical protein
MFAHDLPGYKGPIKIEPCDCDKEKSLAVIVIHGLGGQRVALCLNCAPHVVYEVFQIIRASNVEAGHA